MIFLLDPGSPAWRQGQEGGLPRPATAPLERQRVGSIRGISLGILRSVPAYPSISPVLQENNVSDFGPSAISAIRALRDELRARLDRNEDYRAWKALDETLRQLDPPT